MAFTATAVGRIRPGGSVNNGTFYDGAAYPGGTDYTQQDAAQLTLADLNSSTNHITSATGGFTAAMVGNAINLGTTFYFITARNSSTDVTVDRTVSPGLAAATGSVGGAWGGSSGVNPFYLADAGRATHNKPVPGNIIYVYGSGSDAPGSADYTFTGTTNAVNGYALLANGDTTNGRVEFVGENGRPRVHGTGCVVQASTMNRIANFYFYATSNNSGSNGVIRMTRSIIENCVINTNNQSTLAGLSLRGGIAVNNEIWSGTTSPSTSAGSIGIQSPSGTNTGYHVTIIGNKIHHMGGAGLSLTNPSMADLGNNWIYANIGNGITFTETDTNNGSALYNNVIDGNTGDGLNVNNLNSFSTINAICGNIFSNNNRSGKFGINIAAGTLAAVEKIRRFLNFNFFYNNTTHRSTNYAAGPDDVDLSADPYTNAAAFDFSLNRTAGGGAAVRAVGFPPVVGSYPATGFTRASYPDGGAVQHQDSGGTVLIQSRRRVM